MESRVGNYKHCDECQDEEINFFVNRTLTRKVIKHEQKKITVGDMIEPWRTPQMIKEATEPCLIRTKKPP